MQGAPPTPGHGYTAGPGSSLPGPDRSGPAKQAGSAERGQSRHPAESYSRAGRPSGAAGPTCKRDLARGVGQAQRDEQRHAPPLGHLEDAPCARPHARAPRRRRTGSARSRARRAPWQLSQMSRHSRQKPTTKHASRPATVAIYRCPAEVHSRGMWYMAWPVTAMSTIHAAAQHADCASGRLATCGVRRRVRAQGPRRANRLLRSSTCVEGRSEYREEANIVRRDVPGEAIEPQARHGSARTPRPNQASCPC